jgi:hypothetical protein
MSEVPTVDYRATSARPAWSALPAELQRSLYDAVSVALGTEIVTVGPSVGSGFTGGFAAPAQLADGRTVFIKSAPAGTHTYDAYQREAQIVPQLPPAVRVPRILTTTSSTSSAGEADWFAVVSEGITARMPGMPWSQPDFELVTASCEIAAEALCPSPIGDLKPARSGPASGRSRPASSRGFPSGSARSRAWSTSLRSRSPDQPRSTAICAPTTC